MVVVQKECREMKPGDWDIGRTHFEDQIVIAK